MLASRARILHIYIWRAPTNIYIFERLLALHSIYEKHKELATNLYING